MVGDIEVYSIDECFLKLLSTTTDTKTFGRKLKDRVMQDIGMPVCAGIAPTETLAKLANRATKKIPVLQGVCAMDTKPKHEWVLKRFDFPRLVPSTCENTSLLYWSELFGN